MRKLFLLLTTILFWQVSPTWAGIGDWRSHFAYHNATQCIALNGKVYVVSNGSLYSYTPKDEFIECYDKSNILSDQGISHIAACDKSNTLVVVYENANIDLIKPNGKVVNITDYKNEVALDPKVNGLCVINGKAFLATNFGLSILDVEREEFGNTYMFNQVAYSGVELDGIIYVATESGVYCGDTHTNLLDISNWNLLDSNKYAQLAVFAGQLMALKSKEAVYKIDAKNGVATTFRKGNFNFVRSINGELIIGDKTNVYVYNTLTDYYKLTFDGTVGDVAFDGKTYWTANGAKGLNGYQYDKENKKTVNTTTGIIPNSPIRNYCQYLDFVDDGRLLVAGGCLNYFGTTFYNGTLMMYEDETWYSFEEDGIANRTAGRYRNMTSIVQDPRDPSHHYASSYGQGIYEFRDLKFVKQYTHKEKDGLEDVVATSLESVVPSSFEYTRISRLKYDNEGNMWITNSHAESPVKIMKPDGTFISLYYPELEHQETVSDVLFDRNGWVWIVSLQGPANLFCIDLNGTLENTADDRIKVFNEKFIDQDGGSVEVFYINDIAADHNGDLWVMTDKGPYVLYNTKEVFQDDYHFTKVKVPRNDGTNYADYLLDGAYTTCVEIDAANRKWIGTLNNGVYLIGPNGLEEVLHFTQEDSPLPSDAIESLAINHLSGEVFIGTDKGLVSYMSDATQGEASFDEDKVYAYPNPVASYYDGLITVVGLKADSHVKVINTAGRLVAEGTSLGGTFTWDGRTPQGQRVATGVYYVMGSDEQGNEGIVTKVLFIK